MIRKSLKKIVVWMIAISLMGSVAGMDSFAPETTEAAVALKLKVGQIYSVKKKAATYTTSDTSVAYVNPEGRVTGKKPGTVVITIHKTGKDSKKTFRIVKNAKKSELKVCPDELRIAAVNVKEVDRTEIEKKQENNQVVSEEVATDEKDTVTDDTDSKPEEDDEAVQESVIEKIIYTYKVRVKIKNVGSADVKRVVLKGKLGTKTVKLFAKDVKAKKSTIVEKTVKVTSKAPIEQIDFQLNKIEDYISGMVCAFNYNTEKISYQYATKDKKAPVISGFVGKNSYNGNVPYQTVYSDQEKTYDYFKYVSAEDDRDTKVDLTVETSKVDFSKKGIYTITYIAKDKAGNTSKAKAKIAVRVNDSLDQMAATILGRITKKNWSDQRKATAIYNYTRGHIAYTGNSDKSSWENEAARGIRYGQGDCFTYYCVARALLTRAGIPNIEVTRVQGHGHHWWNMVYMQSQGGFYHFDTCPRKAGGRFCLVTDAQLKNYSATVGHNSHIWAYNKKPKSPTKILTYVF